MGLAAGGIVTRARARPFGGAFWGRGALGVFALRRGLAGEEKPAVLFFQATPRAIDLGGPSTARTDGLSLS